MKKQLVLLLLCFYSFAIYSQKSGNSLIDSLVKQLPSIKEDTTHVNALLDLSMAYEKIDPTKGLYYGEKALATSIGCKWKEGISRSLCCISANYLVSGESDMVLKNSLRALPLTTNKQTLSFVYRNLGMAYRSKASYSKALDYSFKALSISEELKDSVNIAQTLNKIGSIYYYTDDFEKALLYFNKSLKLNTRLNAKSGMADVLLNMGILYSDSYKDSLALGYFSKALKLSIEQNDRIGILLNYLVTGKLHLDNNEPDKALPDILEMKRIAKELGNNRYYSGAITTQASIYLKMAAKTTPAGKDTLLSRAEFLLREAIMLSKHVNNLLNLSLNYKLLSELYSLKGDDKQAKEVYILYSDFRDSIYNNESKETIKNLEDSRTIALKDKEIELNKLSIESKEKQKWFLISGILLFSVIVILLIYQNRSRKKTNEKLHILNAELEEANRIKTRFFTILNHDLRSPVSNLIHFLHLKNESPELLTEQSKHAMETKVVSAAENLLISMEDLLLWSKGQMQNFQPVFKTIHVAQLFEDLRNHFLSAETIRISFEDPEHCILISDPDYLKTILRNLTGNSVKALEKTGDPIIVWKARQEHHKTYLSITDNGPGGSEEQFKALYDETEVVGIKTGLGLHLIRDLAKAINCTITVESKAGAGVCVILSFS